MKNCEFNFGSSDSQKMEKDKMWHPANADYHNLSTEDKTDLLIIFSVLLGLIALAFGGVWGVL